jgi:hypothetical protein
VGLAQLNLNGKVQAGFWDMRVDRLLVQQRGRAKVSTPETPNPTAPPPHHQTRFAPVRPGRLGVGLAAAFLAAFALGGGVTAAALQARRPTLVMLTPSPIASMANWSEVAVKGQVAEVFGNKFIIQDDSGRALVDTGPIGENGNLVTKSETVSVQGRFEHGSIHAQAISHPDGRNDLVGPPGPPPLGSPGGPRRPDAP